jgi:hypothetical protein
MNKITKTTANGKVQIPDGYRLLKKSELVMTGDLFTTPARDDWEETFVPDGTEQNPFVMKSFIRLK